MAKYPNVEVIGANREPLSFTGSYPFRIVHHTTEGSSLEGAVAAYRSHKGWPHFTVQGKRVVQHIDTSTAAFALRNTAGGVDTNRARAIQIEVVGFAGRAKDRATLGTVAKLCRWLEVTHKTPHAWPNGYPKVAVNGRDPGNHNRNVTTWAREGGHYGHCHVPENSHWDPGYTLAEVGIIMAVTEPPTPTPTPPVPEEDEMPGIIALDDSHAYYIDGGVKVHLDPDSYNALVGAGVKVVKAGGLVARTPTAGESA